MDIFDVSEEQIFIRILIDEAVQVQHEPTWRVLFEKAREQGMAGCTVLRGFAGFGPHHGFHSEVMLDAAGEFTMVLEIVDSEEKTKAFLKSVGPLLSKVLVITEKVFVRQHLGKKDQKEVAEVTSDPSQQKLLRVFMGEGDKVGYQSLFTEVLHQAKKHGLAGATVSRGVAGFGAEGVTHQNKHFQLSADLPVIVEIIDDENKIDEFLGAVEPLLKGALVIEEKVEVRHY